MAGGREVGFDVRGWEVGEDGGRAGVVPVKAAGAPDGLAPRRRPGPLTGLLGSWVRFWRRYAGAPAPEAWQAPLWRVRPGGGSPDTVGDEGSERRGPGSSDADGDADVAIRFASWR